MSAVDDFLSRSPLPKWVQVSRTKDNTEIVMTPNPFAPLITTVIISLLVGTCLVWLSLVLVKHIFFDPRFPLQNQALKMLLVYLDVAAVGITAIFAFCKFVERAVIRVDSATGNFVMFKRLPFYKIEGDAYKYKKNTVIPVVRKNYQEDRRMNTASITYRLDVYPDLESYRAGPGFLLRAKNVFFLPNWSRKRCEWIRRLILAIREIPLSAEENEKIYNFWAGDNIHAKRMCASPSYLHDDSGNNDFSEGSLSRRNQLERYGQKNNYEDYDAADDSEISSDNDSSLLGKIFMRPIIYDDTGEDEDDE